MCSACHSQKGVPGRRGDGVVNGVSGFDQIRKITARSGSVFDTLINAQHVTIPGLLLNAADLADLTAYLETISASPVRR